MVNAWWLLLALIVGAIIGLLLACILGANRE